MFISGDPGLSPFYWFYKNHSKQWRENGLLFSHARGALNYYLHKLHLESGEEKRAILLPDYICNDLVSAVEEAGFTVNYYKIGESYNPIIGDVIKKITEKTLAVMVVHYFGFISPVDELVQYCREKDIPIIEDCAHFLYNTDIKLRGDASIFSLKKFFPIPDGGLLIVRDSGIDRGINAVERYKMSYRGLSKYFIKYILSHTNYPVVRSYNEIEHVNKGYSGIKTISMTSEAVLEKYYDIQYIKRRRRENFIYYADTFRRGAERDHKFEMIHDKLKDCDIPYMLPLKLRDDNKTLISHLRKIGIPAISWPTLPDKVKNTEQHKTANELHNKTILLPLHQDITYRHIDHILQKFLHII